ncbi:MAG: hypothetical protein QOG25_1634 [Acetobacteraceae bacterium]|nr:hypothetical protein [Acetobacteraceae bacterium]
MRSIDDVLVLQTGDRSGIIFAGRGDEFVGGGVENGGGRCDRRDCEGTNGGAATGVIGATEGTTAIFVPPAPSLETWKSPAVKLP